MVRDPSLAIIIYALRSLRLGTQHTRAKHPKSSWKVLYTCRTCDFYTATPERMRAHYLGSSVHKSCDTCEEPFYDLPRPNSVRWI